MPLVPRGLSAGLFERLKERTRKELTRRVVDPIRERVEEWVGFEPATPGPEVPPVEAQEPAYDEGTKRFRISQSGQNRRLLYMKYNGVWRMVMPMKWFSSKAGNQYVYAYCGKDNYDIELFRLSKIGDCRLTERPWPFEPDYPVEV